MLFSIKIAISFLILIIFIMISNFSYLRGYTDGVKDQSIAQRIAYDEGDNFSKYMACKYPKDNNYAR